MRQHRDDAPLTSPLNQYDFLSRMEKVSPRTTRAFFTEALTTRRSRGRATIYAFVDRNQTEYHSTIYNTKFLKVPRAGALGATLGEFNNYL